MNEIDHFSEAVLAQQARGNVATLVFGTLAFLRERDLPAADWATSLSRRLAPRWELLRGRGAWAVAATITLHLLTGGGTLESLSGDEHRADAVIGFPLQSELEAFPPATLADFRAMLAMFGAGAERLGLGWQVELCGERIHLSVTGP